MIDTSLPGDMLPVFEPGDVWLVGAGPGDPGLLTLYALDALRQADVVVYDALVDERVLTLVRSGASLEYAGKRGGKPSARQTDITHRLIELAHQRRRVLRLKGGDPFVFGRGGEEALALAAAGIRFRIVPGVTSGLAGLASALVPATTRDTNHAVILATGHAGEGIEDSVDWPALGRTGQPMILYMALKNLPDIAAGLIAGGLEPSSPVVMVMAATTRHERVVESTIARAAADAEAAGLAAPVIIGVGANAAIRARLKAHALSLSAPHSSHDAATAGDDEPTLSLEAARPGRLAL
ncbi:MAG: uroporphyrinogen-III C-methyltransferase [Hyphomicrobiaceae bacterium]